MLGSHKDVARDVAEIDGCVCMCVCVCVGVNGCAGSAGCADAISMRVNISEAPCHLGLRPSTLCEYVCTQPVHAQEATRWIAHCPFNQDASKVLQPRLIPSSSRLQSLLFDLR